MIGMVLRFGPYIAIAALSLLLYAAKAHIDELEARHDQCIAECNARISDGAAEAARAALRERDLAVQRERERWQDLVARSNQAAAAAEQEREAAESRASDLKRELDALYRSDPDAQEWAATSLPAGVLERLRSN